MPSLQPKKSNTDVRRIDFVGNTTTRDKVIRREMILEEGALFNKRYLEISILRLNQLDYFDRIEEDKSVELKRNTQEGTVDLTLKLKEKGKQSISLQGGVSGLAGTFIGLTYQTNNFLGLGKRSPLRRSSAICSASFLSVLPSLISLTAPFPPASPYSTAVTILTRPSRKHSY